MVVNQVRMEDEDSLDLIFWLSKDASEDFKKCLDCAKITSLGLMDLFRRRWKKW